MLTRAHHFNKLTKVADLHWQMQEARLLNTLRLYGFGIPLEKMFKLCLVKLRKQGRALPKHESSLRQTHFLLCVQSAYGGCPAVDPW